MKLFYQISMIIVSVSVAAAHLPIFAVPTQEAWRTLKTAITYGDLARAQQLVPSTIGIHDRDHEGHTPVEIAQETDKRLGPLRHCDKGKCQYIERQKPLIAYFQGLEKKVTHTVKSKN